MIEIPLGNGPSVLIDEQDLSLVAGYTWYAVTCDRNQYAVAHTPGQHQRKIAMHRLIMDFPSGLVDHRDGNGLNNTRANLRLASPRQNAMNGRKRAGLSMYRGVRLNSSGTWRAQIWDGARYVALGSYATEAEAAHAYDAAAIQMRGEFARLNFPPKRHSRRSAPHEPLSSGSAVLSVTAASAHSDGVS